MKEPRLQFSTAGLSPSQVFPLWRDALYQAGIGSEVGTPAPSTFFASQIQYDFGEATLNMWKSKANEVRKTKSDCLRVRSNHYSLCYVKEGSLVTQQSGREAVVEAGDCVLRNADDPSFLRTAYFDALTLHIPTPLIEKWIPFPRDVTAMSLGKRSRWGGALSASLAALEPEALDQLAIPPQTVVENICSLLALTIGPEKQTTTEHESSTLTRYRHILRERFVEPDFSPALLASAQNVSRRTIHYVFANAGSSFGAELKALRMEKARQFLDDKRFTDRPIADIAQLVGFVHTSHFITCFRETYGVTPLAYRVMRRS